MFFGINLKNLFSPITVFALLAFLIALWFGQVVVASLIIFLVLADRKQNALVEDSEHYLQPHNNQQTPLNGSSDPPQLQNQANPRRKARTE